MKNAPIPQKSLFIRILFLLTIPLIFLGATITALQIGNQVQSLNELHKIESRWVFDNLRSEFGTDFKDPAVFENISALKSKLKVKANALHLAEISIWDVLNQQAVAGSWSDMDKEQVEKSFYAQQQGEPYHIFVSKASKELSAYIPLQGAVESVYVVKASFSLGDIKTALYRSRAFLIFMMLLILAVGTVIGMNLSSSIVKPILQLNKVSQDIAQGELGKQVHITTGDEIQLLAETFNEMSNAMRIMRKKAKDANPLTGLPGNEAIFDELKKRIFEGQKFVLFHSDLDRFKVFNDHYGLAKGDDAIKLTAELLQKCVREKGALDDFVGHEGGDDFVIITRPHKAVEIGEAVCGRFGKEVSSKVYNKEDYERGYTLHEDRRGAMPGQEIPMVKFPLLGISLAGISNAKKDVGDHVQCMKAAVEVKKIVKKNEKSSYIIQE